MYTIKLRAGKNVYQKIITLLGNVKRKEPLNFSNYLVKKYLLDTNTITYALFTKDVALIASKQQLLDSKLGISLELKDLI